LKRRTYLFLAVFVICCSFGYTITALDVFNEGRRSFDLGRWQESKETFARFMATWPEHKLKSEALYYFSLASARTLPERAREYSDCLVDEIAAAIGTLSAELPDKDLTELKVAVKLSGNRSMPVAWSELTALEPAELKHYLSRGWHPDPSATPIEMLFWETSWRKKNTSVIEPDLTAAIALLKARALWQIMLSPLSLSANSDILKTWGCWPVHTCFEKEVNQGFKYGNPDIKRELALLGYHYDCFRNGGFAKADVSPRKSRWYTYLSERGLNLQEAWCPR
jgi:hypothetical protein